jgi:putative oxidoreductase
MRSDTWHSIAALVGRIALSAIFLLSGFNKITNWSGTADHMAHEGMVAVPVFLAGAIAFEVLGGLSLLLGVYGRVGAAALIAFLIPATLIFHDFWAVDPAQQQNQMIHFLKNVAIMGGLLTVVAHGTGRFSVDRRLAAATSRSATSRRRDEAAMVG